MLARLKPDPIPAINPRPEYAVDGEAKDLYEDTKRVLQVPWMGVVTMAYAHYLPFYRVLWQGLRPLLASRPFVETSRQVRALVEARVAELSPPPIVDRLADRGYAARELDQIRAMIEVFSHGNFPYAVIATLARLCLEGDELPAQRDAPPFQGRHAPDLEIPFILMEPHHADAPTRDVYADVKKTLGLPFVNTDYRALARWPSYFAMAWGDIRSVVGTGPYEALVQDVHDELVGRASRLPNPSGLTASAVREAAAGAASQDEIREVCRLFQWLLPGLVTNVAFFRHQLSAASASGSSS